jgi:hypothetical protein
MSEHLRGGASLSGARNGRLKVRRKAQLATLDLDDAPPLASRIRTHVAEDTLSEGLESSAARFAQSGLRAHLDGDPAVYLLHAATALELLAKALLASLHGSLIAAAKDFDSLLHVSNHSRHARQPPTRMRTITMPEALSRVGQVVPALENLRPSLILLAEIRNGVVHAGQLDVQSYESVLVPFMTACDHLLAAMPQPNRGRFWGEFVEMVDVRISDSAKVAEVAAAEAITVARLAFDGRFSPMDRATREAVLSGIEGAYAPTKYEETLVTCPACDTPALAHGSYDVDWEPEWEIGDDGEPWSPGAVLIVTFRPGSLECHACGLSLDGEDELRAAGVPESWQLDDADPRDFYESDLDWE